MKKIFIYWGKRPNNSHELLAKTQTNEFYSWKIPYLPNIFINGLIKSLFIPNVDLYLCESPPCLLPAIVKKFFNKNIKIVMLGMDSFQLYYDSKPPFIKSIIKNIVFKNVDLLVVNSNRMYEFYKNIVQCKIKIIFPIVDKFEQYYEKNPNFESCKVIFIGSINEHKGADIIKSIAEISNKNIVFDLVGNHEKFSLNNLNYLGRIDKPYEIVNNYLIYLHPAREEPFGVALIEALASGLIPVISSNIGALDVLKELPSELIINDLNPISYSKKIEEIINLDKNKKKKLSKLMKNLALKFYKKHSTQNQLDEFKNIMSSEFD